MTRTPAQALSWALQHSVGYSNYCLQYVREAYGVGPRDGSAIEAWNNASKRHSSWDTAPNGAALFFKSASSKFGHCALKYDLNGTRYIRTTNSGLGHPATQTLALWQSWGYVLLGWTEDINGVHVADPVAKPAPAPSGIVLTLGSKGQHVTNFQTGMRRVFPAYAKESNVKPGQLISIDGVYGAQSKEWARIFQSKTGLTQDGIVGKNTIAKLATFGITV